MKKILIADDRAAGRELIRAMLESAGYRVIEAVDGAEALVRIAEEQPDLVLLDLQMPVMDGFAAIREMRSNRDYDHIPAIALTASAMSGDRERALREGFTGYITKPVRFRELLDYLNQVLAK